VRLALAWPGEYWPGLALAWLEHGYPLSGVRQAVVALKDDQRRVTAATASGVAAVQAGGPVRFCPLRQPHFETWSRLCWLEAAA
jgi:hypothetical protein